LWPDAGSFFTTKHEINQRAYLFGFQALVHDQQYVWLSPLIKIFPGWIYMKKTHATGLK
jgi:hypothetical protein